MKFIKPVLSLLFVLLLAGGVFLYLNFGSLAKNTAEKIASNALGVAVTISSLDISLKDKRAVLTGLKIANPDGYRNPHAITAEKLVVGLNTASKELVDIDDVEVDDVTVYLELTERGANITDLKKLANQKKQKESFASEKIRVIVRKMVVGTSTVHTSIAVLNTNFSSIQVPPVRISGIGTKSNGVLAKEAVRQIFVQYIKAVESRALSQEEFSFDQPVTEFEEAVDNAVEDIKGLFD